MVLVPRQTFAARGWLDMVHRLCKLVPRKVTVFLKELLKYLPFKCRVEDQKESSSGRAHA